MQLLSASRPSKWSQLAIFLLLTILRPGIPPDIFANAQEQQEQEQDAQFTPTATLLTNGKPIPLLGLGLGNLEHQMIPLALMSTFTQNNMGYELLDTGRQSNNEKFIASQFSTIDPEQFESEVFVTTKVWYTYLGYERTKISVRESLKDLEPNTRVNILINWPRCDESVAWMDCQGEEDALPQYVKDAGPNPLFSRNAFLESWRALEDIYMENERVGAIGVSNFSRQDWDLLIRSCRIIPHIHQGNVWSAFFDGELMRVLNEYSVLFQAYDVMNGIVKKVEQLPNLKRYFVQISSELGVENYSTLIIAWFLQHRIGVVVRSSDEKHLEMNSPVVVHRVQALKELAKNVADLIHHAIQNEDVIGHDDGVVATFINQMSKPVQVFWKGDDGNRQLVAELRQVGEESELRTHPGHNFVAVSEGKEVKLFKVQANYGEKEYFRIEL